MSWPTQSASDGSKVYDRTQSALRLAQRRVSALWLAGCASVPGCGRCVVLGGVLGCAKCAIDCIGRVIVALSDKQALFVEEYLRTFNATQAAEAAGYSSKSAYSIGWENLRKPEIAEVISQRLSETAMSADEVLRRLGEHARGNMGDFWKIPDKGEPSLNLTTEKAKASLHLIKKMKVKTTKRIIADIDEVTTEIDFELYDAQAALEKLGRHHKLFSDSKSIELTGKNGAPIELKTEHAIDPDTATSIFDILAEAGVFESGASDAKADEVYPASADA